MKFQTQQRLFSIGSLRIALDTITNTADLLDELIAQGPTHPDYQDEVIPYWADLWPSALGLSYYLAENCLDVLEDARVLELGCGLGLPGLVAAQLGAQLTFTDYVQAALDFARHNLSLNPATRHPAHFQCLDWRAIPPEMPQFDCLLAADVAYEKRFFTPLYDSIHRLLAPAGCCYLSEPGRDIAKEFLSGFEGAGFQVSQVKHYPDLVLDGVRRPVWVYEVRKK